MEWNGMGISQINKENDAASKLDMTHKCNPKGKPEKKGRQRKVSGLKQSRPAERNGKGGRRKTKWIGIEKMIRE